MSSIDVFADLQRCTSCILPETFPGITFDEQGECNYCRSYVKVDVLGEPEPVDSLEDLDPKRYGLIIESVNQPWKRGLLLPNLEGIETVEKQVYWTRYHKAGIKDPAEPVQMLRFEVIRYT